jgi:hypothetical protein
MKMKRLFIVLLSFCFFANAFAQEKETEQVEGPKIVFEESVHNFGDINQGDVVSHTFKFTNEGTEPLVLSNVLTSCGCTAPNWSRDPIPPGEEGEITVRFNSRGKIGRQNKTITIVSNALKAQERIRIVTNILPPQKDNSK